MSTATLNWIFPATDVNNAPLPVSAITETLIFEAIDGVAASTTPLATVPAPATTFTTGVLNPGSTYVFTVEVMDAAGTSQMSASATVVVPLPAPGVPDPATGLTATLNQ